MQGIEGAAFDLDGTLYPNYRLNILLIPFLLKEWRLIYAFGRARKIIREQQEISSAPQYIPSVQGDFYEYQAGITAKIIGVPPEAMKEKIESMIYRKWEPLFKKVKLFKGAAETLAALKKAGFKLGLLSDFPPETKLKYLGLSDGWDAVLCSERCGALKPHPRSFTELAAAMSLPPEKILYVGSLKQRRR